MAAKFKKFFLALLTVALGAMSSGAMAIADVPISVNGTSYNFNYVEGTYDSLSGTYFNTTYMPWWTGATWPSFPDGAAGSSSAITYANAVNTQLGAPNCFMGCNPPYFASGLADTGDGHTAVYGANYSSNMSSSYTSGFGLTDRSNFYAVITPASAAVPEIDGALIPQVGFLLAGLFLMFGRRKLVY